MTLSNFNQQYLCRNQETTYYDSGKRINSNFKKIKFENKNILTAKKVYIKTYIKTIYIKSLNNIQTCFTFNTRMQFIFTKSRAEESSSSSIIQPSSIISFFELHHFSAAVVVAIDAVTLSLVVVDVMCLIVTVTITMITTNDDMLLMLMLTFPVYVAPQREESHIFSSPSGFFFSFNVFFLYISPDRRGGSKNRGWHNYTDCFTIDIRHSAKGSFYNLYITCKKCSI